MFKISEQLLETQFEPDETPTPSEPELA